MSSCALEGRIPTKEWDVTSRGNSKAGHVVPVVANLLKWLGREELSLCVGQKDT